MSGLFSKLSGKNKPAKELNVEESLALAKDSMDESWTAHEVSDDIHEEVDTIELESPGFDMSVDVPVGAPAEKLVLVDDENPDSALLSEAEFESLRASIEHTATRLAKLDLNDIDIGDRDIGEFDDPMNDITQKIKADIANDRRLKIAEARTDAVLEVTSEFGLPDFELSAELPVFELNENAKK